MSTPVKVSRVVHARLPCGDRLVFENLVDLPRAYVLLAASQGCELCAAEIADFSSNAGRDSVNSYAYAWADADEGDTHLQISSFQTAEREALPELRDSASITTPTYFITTNGVLEWRLTSDALDPTVEPSVHIYDNSGVSREDVLAALAAATPLPDGPVPSLDAADSALDADDSAPGAPASPEDVPPLENNHAPPRTDDVLHVH